MDWNVVAERTKLFALIWGTMSFGAISPAFVGIHGGYPADVHAPPDVAEAVIGVLLVSLMSCCGGVLPALLYAFLLGFYERDQTEQNKSLLVPLLICVIYELPIFVWLATGPGADYGPDGGFNGGFRIGVTGYVAALSPDISLLGGRWRNGAATQNHPDLFTRLH